MAFSTDVNLPRKHAATFPPRCIRCNSDPGGKTLRIWTHSVGWWTALFWMFGSPFSVHIPACSRCALRIRIQRVGSTIVILAIASFIIFLVWPYVDDLVARSLRKWVVMALALLAISPWFLWEVFFPPSIDITAYSDSVDYEFRDSKYASDFASMNADAEWVKIE